jgi:hypothetical protein
VKECGIEIPVSEFRAFAIAAPPPGREGTPLTHEEKRQALEKLLDDNFWIWQGYSEKADQSEQTAQMLKITENEAMKALLIEQEGGSRASTQAEYEKVSQELRRRIFDRAEIHLSPRAYERLKSAARRLNETGKSAAKTPSTDSTDSANALGDGLSQAEREMALATCKIGMVRVGDFLSIYMEAPVETRSDLEKPEAVIALLRSLLEDRLLLAAARERGLDRAEPVRQQVQSDRTGLARLWALDQVTKKAVQEMKEAETEEKLKQWYEAHQKSLFTVRDESGAERVLTLEKDKELIQNDYFNDLLDRLRTKELQSLRQGRKIEIDEPLLDALVIHWPGRPVAKPETDRGEGRTAEASPSRHENPTSD